MIGLISSIVALFAIIGLLIGILFNIGLIIVRWVVVIGSIDDIIVGILDNFLLLLFFLSLLACTAKTHQKIESKKANWSSNPANIFTLAHISYFIRVKIIDIIISARCSREYWKKVLFSLFLSILLLQLLKKMLFFI